MPTPPATTSHNPPAIENDAETIAATIKDLRKARGLTLDELSAQSEVSKSTLSRIENGKLSPTYDLICKIATGLKIDVRELFGAPSAQRFSGWRSITRKGDEHIVETPHYELQFLCTDVPIKRFMVFKAIIRARSADEFEKLPGHEGEEQILVLKGQVQVITELYQPATLSEGESISFDSRMGHALISTSEEDAEVVWVTQQPSTIYDIADFKKK